MTLAETSTEDLLAELKRRGATLKAIRTKDLLEELEGRGSTFTAVARAQLLVLKKSMDYNGTEEPGAKRDVYFPLGTASYAQMIHTKSQRFLELTKKGGGANFESLEDTALDLINYASFFLDWRQRGSP